MVNVTSLLSHFAEYGMNDVYLNLPGWKMLLITAIEISGNHDMASVKFTKMNNTTSSLKKIVSAVKSIGNVNIENLKLFSHGKKNAAANDTVFIDSLESHPGINTAKEKDNANEPMGDCYPERFNPFSDETLPHTKRDHDSVKRQEHYPEAFNPFCDEALPHTKRDHDSVKRQENYPEKLNPFSDATLPHTKIRHDSASWHESHPEQKIATRANPGVTPISPTRDQPLIDPENTAHAGTPFVAANQNPVAQVAHSTKAADTRHPVLPPVSLSDTPLHTIGNPKSKEAKGGVKGMCKFVVLKLKKAGARKITTPQMNTIEIEKKSSDKANNPNLVCSITSYKNTNNFFIDEKYDHAKLADRSKLNEIIQGRDPGNDIINFIDESMVTRYFIGKGLENVKGVVRLTKLNAFSAKKVFQTRHSQITNAELFAVMKGFDIQVKKNIKKVDKTLTSNMSKIKENENKTLGSIYDKLKRSLFLAEKKIAKERGGGTEIHIKNDIEDPIIDTSIKSKIKTKVHEAFSGEVIINACKNDTCLVDSFIESFHGLSIKETTHRIKGAELNAEATVIKQYFETVFKSYRELVEHQEKILATISDKNGFSYPNLELENMQISNRNRYLTEIKNSIHKIISESSQGLNQEFYRIERKPGRLEACVKWFLGKKPKHERIDNAARKYVEKWYSLHHIIKNFPQNGTTGMLLSHELNTAWKEMITPEQLAKNVEKKMNSMQSRWRLFVSGLKSPASMGVATACFLLAGLSVVSTITLPVSALIASVYLIAKWKEAHDAQKVMQIRRNESQNTYLNIGK